MSQTPRLRTCIAHRTRRPDTELLRVVVENNDDEVAPRVVPDPHRRLPGRGAWLTPDLAAYELAQSRRAFARALRVSASVDTGPVREYLTTTQIVRKTEH